MMDAFSCLTNWKNCLALRRLMSEIDDAISNATGVLFKSQSSSSIGGGCINQASKIHSMDGRTFFIKINQASFLPFFEAEAIALKEIRSTQTIMAPNVITHGLVKDQAFLVLEYIEEGRSSLMSQKIWEHYLRKCTRLNSHSLDGKEIIASVPLLSPIQKQTAGLCFTGSPPCFSI